MPPEPVRFRKAAEPPPASATPVTLTSPSPTSLAQPPPQPPPLKVLSVPFAQTTWSQPSWGGWIAWLIVIGIVFVVGFVFRENDPNRTLASASIACWAVFVGSWVALWLVCRIVTWITMSVIIIVRESNASRIILTGIYFSVCYLLWTVLIVVAFYGIFNANPFPARVNGTKSKLDFDRVWWLPRLMIVNIFLGVLLVLRGLAVVRLRFGTRLLNQASSVKDALRAEEVLQDLTDTITPTSVLSDKRPRRKQQFTEYDAAVTLQKLWRFRKRVDKEGGDDARGGGGDGDGDRTERNAGDSKDGTPAGAGDGEKPRRYSLPSMSSAAKKARMKAKEKAEKAKRKEQDKEKKRGRKLKRGASHECRVTHAAPAIEDDDTNAGSVGVAGPITKSISTPDLHSTQAESQAGVLAASGARHPDEAQRHDTDSGASSHEHDKQQFQQQRRASALTSAHQDTGSETPQRRHSGGDDGGRRAVPLIRPVDDDDDVADDVEEDVDEHHQHREEEGPTTNIHSPDDVLTRGYAGQTAELSTSMSTAGTRRRRRWWRHRLRGHRGDERARNANKDNNNKDNRNNGSGGDNNNQQQSQSLSYANTQQPRARHSQGARNNANSQHSNKESHTHNSDKKDKRRSDSISSKAAAASNHNHDTDKAATAAAAATTAAATTAAAVNSRMTAGEDDPTEVSASLLAGFEAIRLRYITVCRNRVAIKNGLLARRLAEAIFDRYQHNGQVHIATLKDELSSEELFAKAQDMFDPHGTGKADEDWMRERVERVYRDRKNLAITLNDLESITHALASFLTAAVVVLILFALNIAFSTGDYAEVTVTVGTTLFALSFIFADSAKNVFNSFVFLFVQHPFDVGDRVVLPNWDPMYVVRLELLLTTFKVWDGRVVTVPNYVLHTQTLVNIQRAKRQVDPLVIWVDMDTPWCKLEQLEQRYREFLRSMPNDFEEKDSGFFVRGLNFDDGNSVKISMFPQHQTNFQNGEHVARMHALVQVIKEACEELGITYHRPRQRVDVSSSSSSSFASAFNPQQQQQQQQQQFAAPMYDAIV
ncbi:hypothetical protein PTSG_04743 [Salpingoeca rosetta]|uniref:Mechanosensitive ion channel MscS domain-containing protein n=1 Tax=Salpingoeca rosetta (strain ATCC 50818 / BSB-021) TaxID=946362 RepID=F2U9K5_SALR5|nr:uncharacterized protein PTSG_04743 [Salpingoeca rosetta]EGD73032.1 hypothetical protein PTSG_04743 [Salpingoeca rosetta]|eukprot:XP_004994063.1 hypothetical protein PTSG_04743 [Salpingoeca rosetta]